MVYKIFWKTISEILTLSELQNYIRSLSKIKHIPYSYSISLHIVYLVTDCTFREYQLFPVSVWLIHFLTFAQKHINLDKSMFKFKKVLESLNRGQGAWLEPWYRDIFPSKKGCDIVFIFTLLFSNDDT